MKIKRSLIFVVLSLLFLLFTSHMTYYAYGESVMGIIKNPYVIKESQTLKVLNDVDRTVNLNEKYYSETPTYGDLNLTDFTIKVNEAIFDNYSSGNYIYSPISLYYNLLMLRTGASGDALIELNNLLLDREDEDEFNELTGKLIYDINNNNIAIANSVWSKGNFKSEYIDKVTKNSYAEVIKTDFTISDSTQVANWINHYTNNLFNATPEYAAPSVTELLAINAIYLEAQFSKKFEKINNFIDYFDESSKVTYMKTTADYREVFFTNDFICPTLGMGNKLQLFLFLPTEEYVQNHESKDLILSETFNSFLLQLYKGGLLNYDFDRYNDSILFDSLICANIDRKKCRLTIMMPRFEMKDRIFFSPILKKLKLSASLSSSNYANMFTDDEYLNGKEILADQNIYFKCDNSGIKAAAVTRSGWGCESSMPEENIDYTVYLNRPFVFVLLFDMNIPLFVGYIDNPVY